MKWRAFLACCGLAALAATAAASSSLGCCATPRAAQPFAGTIEARGTERFAIVSDLQTTSMLEFWREENDVERERVVKRIAAERPAFLVMLGDLVSNGSSADAWADFDELCGCLREARIPVLAVPGNHEYWPIAGTLEHYFERFPHLEKRTYFSMRHGPLGLVLLNSNKDQLPDWEAQLTWYREEIRRLEADPEIRGVLVMAHHPPYTNSTVTGDEVHVQEGFVPPFKGAKKTLAMITGHVHSYERFTYGKKMFVVSGGGGGPRAELLSGDARRHPEDLFKGDAIRAFHYLSVAPTPEGLAVEVVGFSDGERDFSVLDAFKLPWASEPSEPSDEPGG
jgi:3',5'-cyclic AMP phosphodiesterase CpdA